MANQADIKKELASTWLERIASADRYYESWEEHYKIKALEDYYYGQQWADPNSSAYVLNMFYSTIETKLPTLIFDNPHFRLKPKPKSLMIDPETAFEVATNLEDTLNDWVEDTDNHFAEEIESSLYEIFFRFGIVEIDYSTEWIDNPRAGKPILFSDSYRSRRDKNVIKQPDQLPINERVYVRHIPADRFRVSLGANKYLNQCDWCGYWEWARIEDLKAAKNLDTSELTWVDGSATTEHSERQEQYQEPDEAMESSGDYIKIWKIWDNRSKIKYVFSETNDLVLFQGKFKILPFEDIRYRIPNKGFYPFPPTFNWKSPQNEINEVREANRNHRRRFKRMYLVRDDAVKDELSKAVNGPDGSMAVVQAPVESAVVPLPNADLGASASQSLVVTTEDFRVVSGTGFEAPEASRITATQSNITDRRATIRESREKTIVANYICRIGKKLIATVKEKYVNPITIASASTNESDSLVAGMVGEMQLPDRQARTINPLTDFGDEDFDFDVTLQIETVSPIAAQEEMDKYLMFLALLQQYPIIAMSPDLIRELAFRTGYKNDRVVKEFQRMAILQMMGQVATGQEAQGGNLGQQTVAQETPPNNEEVRNQLSGQGIPIQ